MSIKNRILDSRKSMLSPVLIIGRFELSASFENIINVQRVLCIRFV